MFLDPSCLLWSSWWSYMQGCFWKTRHWRVSFFSVVSNTPSSVCKGERHFVWNPGCSIWLLLKTNREKRKDFTPWKPLLWINLWSLLHPFLFYYLYACLWGFFSPLFVSGHCLFCYFLNSFCLSSLSLTSVLRGQTKLRKGQPPGTTFTFNKKLHTQMNFAEYPTYSYQSGRKAHWGQMFVWLG